MAQRFKVEVVELRSFTVDVLADDADNARFLAAEKLRVMQGHRTLPASLHVRYLPFSTWEAVEVGSTADHLAEATPQE